MPEASGTISRHRYHAEAGALHGTLTLPVSQTIEPQAHAKLREIGGYESQHAKPLRIEGIVSYTMAHTQVSGHEEEKHGRPFVTLSSSVIENLNVLNVVTADRIVAQVSTEHPREGYVPTVTFLGTQFYNLRIAGKPVEVDLDIDLCNEGPKNVPYTRHPGFMERVAQRLGVVRAHSDLPEEIKKRYSDDRCTFDEGQRECSEYSLVKSITGSFPGRPYGHVIDIPHFGKVFLAVVRVEHSDPSKGKDVHKQTLVELTMLDIRMGCIASGSIQCGTTKTNGSTTPGGG